MSRRRQKKEVIMPDWVTQEAKEEERVLVPVPVRRQEAKKVAYHHAELSTDDKPWYLQNSKDRHEEVTQSWYDKLVEQLAAHLSDMIYLQGPNADVDKLIEDWLNCHKDLYRAVMLELLTKEDVRSILLNKKLDRSVVNSIVRLVFS